MNHRNTINPNYSVERQEYTITEVLSLIHILFVCGGSFVANAQDPVKTQQQQPATGNTEEPKTAEPAKEEPKTEEPKAEEPKAEQPAANAPANGTPATETPAQPAE